MRFQNLLLATLLALLHGFTEGHAQTVTYQREITFPSTVDPVLLTTYAPVNPASVAAPDSHYLNAAGPNNGWRFEFNSTDGTATRLAIPAAVKLDAASLVAITGYGTATSTAYFYTAMGQVVTFRMSIPTAILASPFLDNIVTASSLAASSSGQVTLIGMDLDSTHGGFLINTLTGENTKIFSTEGDSFLSDTTYFQSYGADGMLYLLDYGNNRMAVLDPSDNFSLSSSFAISGDVANMQFALSDDGSVFFGDGEGGGLMYSGEGTLLSAFALPSGSYTSPFANGIAPYVDYTPDGNVFVFDTTGAHQYVVNAVPEPATSALILAALAVIASRRRRKA